MFAGDEAGELVVAAMAPDPAVEPHRCEDDKERGAAEKDGEAHDSRSGKEAVEAEDKEVRKQQAEDSGEDRLRDLGAPQLATEVLQLPPERLGQRGRG